MVYSSTVVAATLPFHDKNINRTQQSSQKVRMAGAVHSNQGRIGSLLKGTWVFWCKPYCSILQGVVHKPQYVWMAGCARSTSWKRRGTGCSPDIAGRRTCARMGLISWHGWGDSQRSGRETSTYIRMCMKHYTSHRMLAFAVRSSGSI